MLKELVEKTRSYRTFASDTEIEESVLLELIDIARKCPAAMNAQPLKYKIVARSPEREALFAITRWAGKLKIKLPPEGHEPSAYIVICHDEGVAAQRPIFLYDIGIVTQTIMLAATERGLGGCIIGSATEDEMKRVLALPEGIVPKLILALGVPDEKVELADAKDGDTSYYRDENGIHYAPKRALEEIIIK